jgi:hypothetical protein
MASIGPLSPFCSKVQKITQDLQTFVNEHLKESTNDFTSLFLLLSPNCLGRLSGCAQGYYQLSTSNLEDILRDGVHEKDDLDIKWTCRLLEISNALEQLKMVCAQEMERQEKEAEDQEKDSTESDETE